MGDDERQKKLEAGREKLAAYRKKQTLNGPNIKNRGDAMHMHTQGDCSETSSAGIQQLDVMSPRSTISSVESGSTDEYEHKISELENTFALKRAQLQATKEEVSLFANLSGVNRDEQESGDANMDMYKSNIDVYNSRLREFQDALQQRDVMITQLTESLTVTMSNKEQLCQDVGQLEGTVTVLQTRLQQATQLLEQQSWGDASPSKMKAYQTQLTECEECVRQQLAVIERLTSEAAAKESEAERSRLELLSLKTQSAKEVQQLMAEVQSLNQKACSLEAERDDLAATRDADMMQLRAQLEENFGLQLTQINNEIRQMQTKQQEQLDRQHSREIEMIQATHREEIGKLRQALQDYSFQSQQSSEGEERLRELQLELQRAITENSSLASELADLKNCQSSWSDDKVSLSSELESLRAQLSSAQVEKHRLDELCCEKDEMTEKLQSLEVEKQIIEDKLNSQIDQLNNLNNENVSVILELKSKFATLEEENKNLVDNMKSIHIEKENLKQELSKVKTLKREVTTYKKTLGQQEASEQRKTEELTCIDFENEVDAAEKGVVSPKRLKLDVPTSPGSIVVWIEKCEALQREFRTAECNIQRLQTQLQNEQLQSKLLVDEKAAAINKIKELQEKNSSLQKTAGSLSRSKKLMNQYEMKIACLENEKSNLQQSLEQLGTELKKSQTIYEDKLHNLQEQLCNSLNVKTDNFEELITESCAKAKELVLIKEELRCQTENETALKNKIIFLDKLVEQHEESFKASQEELQRSQEQLTESWEKLSEQDGLIAQKDRELALLALQKEQLDRQLRTQCQPEEGTGAQRELQALIEELAAEVCELKTALAAEKSRSKSLSKEVSPFETEPKLEHTNLIQKLKKQHKTIDEMKAETNVGDWATRLEEQLGEMIDDVTTYSTQRSNLAELQGSTSVSQETLQLQKQQMELMLKEKESLETVLLQEQNVLRGAQLQIRMLESQLTDRDQTCQALQRQNQQLSEELEALGADLEAKEGLLQEHRLRLEAEVRRRDLQVNQCQAEARSRQVELLAPRSLTLLPLETGENTGAHGRLKEMREALEEVHAAAVARLKLHLGEQMELREAELDEQFSKQQAEIRQEHADQVAKLHAALTSKEQTLREQTHLEIASQLGLEPCSDTAQAVAQIQEKLGQDLALVKQSLAAGEAEIFDMLEAKFRQLAQQQVMLAVARLRLECEASFGRQMGSLNAAHEERLKTQAAKMSYEHNREILLTKQELAKQLKEAVNSERTEAAAAQRLGCLLKEDKDAENRAVLGQLERRTEEQFSETLRKFSQTWYERCKSELESISTQINEAYQKGDGSEKDLLCLQDRVLASAQEMQARLRQQHSVEVDRLRVALRGGHETLQDAAAQAREREALQKQVQLLISERDALLEQRRELEQLQSVVGELEVNSRGVGELLGLREEQHRLAMDELRTYFEHKCRDLEKQYAEKVTSQHSRNSSSSCSENELNSAEILCAEGEHASRLASITRICDTYSDVPSIRDLEEQHKADLDERLTACKEEMETIKRDIERNYQSEIKRIRLEHEEHIKDLARDLQNAHERELQDLSRSHSEELSKLQTVHKEILSDLQRSLLDEQIEQLRSEMSLSETARLRALKMQLEESHAVELQALKLSLLEASQTDTTRVSVTENVGEPVCTSSSDDQEAELRAKFAAELEDRLKQQSDEIAAQVEAVTSAIQQDAQREHARLVASHQQTVAECLEQQHQQLEELQRRFEARLAEVRAQHEDELSRQEENHHTVSTQLREDMTREHKQEMEKLLEALKSHHHVELETAQSRLVECHAREVGQLTTSLEQQEASYVQLLEQTRSMHARELAELAESCKQRLHDEVERSRHELVRTLGEQIQALLVEEGSTSESWPAELRQLQERLGTETKRQLAEARAQHEATVRELQEQHRRELASLGADTVNQKLYADRNNWKSECQLLRTLVSELVQYLITIEEELNTFLDQSRASDSESVASSEVAAPVERKRVHFAPDLETVTSILREESEETDTQAVEELRAELDRCLMRVRKDVANILGISEINLVGFRLQTDQLRASEERREVLESELLITRERLAELERKRREVVTEGYGEGLQPADLEKRLERLSEVQDRARSVLLSSDPEDPPHLLRLIEELCREGDLLSEEARRDKEDLQLQVEAADKQLRSTRAFLEEQALEREQERDEFSRELGVLQETVRERERDRLECARLAKEGAPKRCVEAPAPPAPPCTGPPAEQDNIEVLEAQAKDNSQFLQEAHTKTEELNADLKASSDKISVLREVIHDLESQIEAKTAAEQELRKHLASLQSAFDRESRCHNDLADQIDSLRTDQSTVVFTDHIAVLEEQILAYTRQLEHLQNSSPAVRDMKSQLRQMEASLDKRTRDLERLHNTSASTCSSPSEDVSLREQLEASRAAVGSPEAGSASPLSLQRLQEKMQHHGRAEEAAFKRIRDLEMQLAAVRHSEEEVHAEKCALQQRVEQQLLQISSLQASLDQQRLTQSSLEARDATHTRRQLQAAAERLDHARDLLQAKDTEMAELRGQLEKTKTVIVSQEEEFARKLRESEEKQSRLLEQLETLQQDKEGLEIALEEASCLRSPRKNSRLLDSLLVEKNAEIDELGLQVTLLRERLELISSRLTSDVTREDVMDLMREVRASHGELKSHCSVLHGALQQASSRHSFNDMEVMRESRAESMELPGQHLSLGHSRSDSAQPPQDISHPMSIPSPVPEERPASVQDDRVALASPAPPTLSQAEAEALHEELASTRHILQLREEEINKLRTKLKDCSDKLGEEVRHLQQENSLLKHELNAMSGRLEDYAQLMQSEMDHSAALDRSLLQLAGEGGEQGDELQRLLARVHRGGFEVLSLSEVALLHRHTQGLLTSHTVATQTSRSGCSEATQLAQLRQVMALQEQTANTRDQKMLARVASLETALSGEQELRTKAEAALLSERRSLAEARGTQEAQMAEMQMLRERAEEVQTRVEQQDRTMQQLRLEVDKERLRAASLESLLAAEELNSLKQRAQLEGECVRHRATTVRNSALSELLDSKLAQAHESELSLRTLLEQEQSWRRSLQDQLNALQRSKDSGSLDNLNRELKAGLEREQALTSQLVANLREERGKATAALQEVESRAQREVAVEREALEQTQQQLHEALAQVQSERETVARLRSRIQELEAQSSQLREAEGVRGEQERLRTVLEASLKDMYQQKQAARLETERLRQQLESVTLKWEEQLAREKAQAEASLGDITAGGDSSAETWVQQLESRQAALLSAERLAWAAEKGALTSQLWQAQHEAQTARTILASERTSWVLERARLNDTSPCVSPRLEVSDPALESKLQYLFGKCHRAESHRKALVWQKRYLLLVLRSCQADQEKLKMGLVRHNGPRHAHLLSEPATIPPLQRFKAVVLVAVAVHRLQFVVRRHQHSCYVGSTVITRRMADALLTSPEPRLEPPLSTLNGQSDANSFSPPTREDLTRSSNPALSPSSFRYLQGSSPSVRRPDLNEFRERSDLLQRLLGLHNKDTTKS